MTSRGLMVALAATLSLANAQPGPPVNSGAAILQDFEKRVAGYVKVHKAAEGKLHSLKPTSSPEKIAHHEGNASRIKGSLKSDEPVALRLRVNTPIPRRFRCNRRRQRSC